MTTGRVGFSSQSLRLIAAGLLALVLGVMLVALIASAFGAVQTTFSVTAETERVELSITTQPPSRWVLDSVEVIRDYGDERPFTGSFQLADSVKVVVERIRAGPLWIHAESMRRTDGSAGTFYLDTEEVLDRAGPVVEILVRDLDQRAQSGRTIVLAVTGNVSSGRQGGIETPGSNALLRSGRVTMLRNAMLGKTVFEAGAIELDLGDQFDVTKPDPLSPTFGFLVVDERPGIAAAYRSVGEGATVTRPGGVTYEVSLSLLRRIVYEPYVQGIAVIAGALAAILGFVSFAMDFVRFRREASGRIQLPVESTQ